MSISVELQNQAHGFTWSQLIASAAGLVAGFTGLVAAFKAINEMKQANLERARAIEESKIQRRWRQAEMAHKLLDQIWGDALARAAMDMLDCQNLKFSNNGKETAPISYDCMLKAMRTTDLDKLKDDEWFIRKAFDQVFDYFDRLHIFAEIGLIEFGDVKGRIEYYVKLMAADKNCFHLYLNTYYTASSVLTFLDRIDSWKGQALDAVMPGSALPVSESGFSGGDSGACD